MRRLPSARTIVAAAVSALALVVTPALSAGAAPAMAQNAAPVDTADPNYIWRTDIISKALAGKPGADRVLHRVPGSFHDAPRVPAEADQARARGNALYGPGTPLYVGNTPGSEFMCTTTVAGYNDRGQKVALTAGHCGNVGDKVKSADAPQLGTTGTITQVDKQKDFAVITLDKNTEVTRSYDGITANHVGGAPVRPGGTVCKKGVASGYTCAPTFTDWDTHNVNHVCAMQGDSGAPLMVGDRVIGMINGGTWRAPFDIACHSPLQGPIHAPTASARLDSVLPSVNGGFRLP